MPNEALQPRYFVPPEYFHDIVLLFNTRLYMQAGWGNRIIGTITLLFIILGLQAKQITFDHISIQEGLSQNSVTALAQDSLGRIWIGTRDGLNLHDGARIRYFRSKRKDSTSLAGHFVQEIVAEKDYLWVITKTGLSRLNLAQLSFKRFKGKGIKSLIRYNKQILIGTPQGLYKLNDDDTTFSPVSNILNDSYTIINLHSDSSNLLWIGTDKGLFVYNPVDQSTNKILTDHITKIFTDSLKQIWVGTLNNGVYLLNNQRTLVHHFLHNNNSNSLVSDIIRDINEDADGNVWIGTFMGLSVIHPHTHNIENFAHTEVNSKSLSNNSIYAMLRDHQGGMWIGTYFGGINYYHSDFNIFNEYKVKHNSDEGLGYNVIEDILEDNKGNLWIATLGGGLDYYNRKDKTFTHYRHQVNKPGLSHNNVTALAFMNKRHLLLGTHNGGLNILNSTTGKIETYYQTEDTDLEFSYRKIDDIIAYRDYFLFATKTGIVKYTPKDKQFAPFFTKPEMREAIGNRINCLFQDSYGILWIGTEERGLFSFDDTRDKLTNYESSPDDLSTFYGNNISCFYEDNQFRLWIGTFGGGLNQYIRNDNKFKNYNHNEHLLPSDFVHGVREAKNGHLWIVTSKGLSRFDVENNKIYNHTQKEGFPLKQLNNRSLCVTKDGEVFIGGSDGLISFKEDDILDRSTSFNIQFTELRINGKRIRPGDRSGVLTHDLPFTKTIVLKPDQNLFSIRYASNNYISTNPHSYQYKLENVNKNWINNGKQTGVSYTNLNPGTYTLRVRGLSGVEDVVMDEKMLIIKILPPIYKTWYAICAYILILSFIIIWFNRIYRTRIRLENTIKLEQQEKEQIKKLNQSKLQFFSNISHEFRTPLTLISGTIESVLEDSKTRPENYQKLIKTHNNVIRLNNLISELLDFRKLEHGDIQLKVTEYNLGTFINEVFQAFVEHAHHRSIKYDLTGTSELQTIWFDKQQMEKVFYNIISNAFKYVDDNSGTIHIKTDIQEQYIDVVIEDNGVGIPADKIEQIFDLYYQVDHISGQKHRHSSGIGLALTKSIVEKHSGEIFIASHEGKGTSFTVRLPKGNRHFKESEFSTFIEQQTITPSEIPVITDSSTIEEQEKSDQKYTLLIVEDNPQVQEMVVEILQPTYNIITAKDGEEGLEVALAEQPDLIVSDVMMPNLSGTEMCARLKRNVQTSHIPVILLTARASINYKIEGLETGADDYITKPFNATLLKTRIKNILHNRVLLQQKFKSSPEIEVKVLTTNTIDEKLLQQARDIIEKNIDNTDFDVNQFAEEMGLGRTKLYKKIKGVTGQTPNDFIQSIRLKKAAEMLLQPNQEMNVSEIAYAVGFSVPRYFSKCFRQHFGVSPTQYGKNN
ncbi:hybrid sensor histidine kinase/response regulator [Puteibacter caeruleilacunae]|nr:hybrid sensor histidine kinase/response regulator [Puteibacter caeruleilacunae]